MKTKEKYVAFLRGINVGGHHKVPMANLCTALKKLNLKNIVTLLNSGNIIFESIERDIENKISEHLEKVFGFPIPTIIRKSESIRDLLDSNPFKGAKISKDTRLYVSFLRKNSNNELKLPWRSVDKSYTIVGRKGKTIFSILDLSVSKTPKAMESLEKLFGKDITTRNWKTIERIGKTLLEKE